MTNVIAIHPDSPQKRLLKQVVAVLERDGVIAYPTDSGYALGGKIGSKSVVKRISQIRQFKGEHFFTLMCRDLTDISLYARVDNPSYRLLKHYTPGSYTFILPASKSLPKLLKHPKRKTIGVRVSPHSVTHALLEELDSPLLSVSLSLPEWEVTPSEPYEIEENLTGRVELILDSGTCPLIPTSVVDLTHAAPVVLREGAGCVDGFL